MGLWLARESIQSGIRAQSKALTLNGRSRSLSSFAFNQIKATVLNLLLANPTGKSDNDSNLTTSSPSRSVSLKSGDEIKSLASYVTTRLDKSISPTLPLIFGSEVFLNTDHIWPTYSDDLRYQMLHDIASALDNIPQADLIQVYHAKIYYMSMLSNDFDRIYDVSKDSLSRRVLSVIETFPKVGNCEVTAETHFLKDLGFDMWDVNDIILALQLEFRLYIPYDLVSCKLAIDYIYEHRTECLLPEEFRKHLFITGVFKGSKSELRRIFVPAEDKKKRNIKSNLDCRAFSYDGFNPYNYFKSMKSRFYCEYGS